MAKNDTLYKKSRGNVRLSEILFSSDAWEER